MGQKRDSDDATWRPDDGDEAAVPPAADPAPTGASPEGTLSIYAEGPDDEELPRGDRYVDVGRIGIGGMGEVRRVRDRVLRRHVARKTLHTHTAISAAARARFLREARLTATLEHPGVVPIHDLGVDAEGRTWFTMKEVRGRTLAEAIRALHGHRLPGDPLAGAGSPSDDTYAFDRLLEALLRVCDAVAYAHANGVLHRDLKPANVVLGHFGEAVVLDWGLARAADTVEPGDEPALATPGTLAGRAMGTPGYMPPEQAAGRHDQVDERSDVWGLGAILYEILCGRPPFSGDGPSVLAALVRGDVVPPPHSVDPAVPLELSAIATRALSRLREHRYPTVAAFAADLRAWMAGQRVDAYRYNLREAILREARRHRRGLLVAAGVTLLGILGGAAAYAELRTERDAALDARAAEVEARRLADAHLTTALVRAAQAALADADHAEAALLAAHALAREERPDARGVLIAAGRALPALKWEDTLDIAAAYAENPKNEGALFPPALSPRSRACGGLAVSPNGRWVACARPLGVDLVDLASGTRSTLGDRVMGALAFSPDGQILAGGSAARDGEGFPVTLWEVGTGRELRRLDGMRGSVFSVAFSRDGGRIAASGADHAAYVWPVEGGAAADLPLGTTLLMGLHWRADGSVLAATGRTWRDGHEGRPFATDAGVDVTAVGGDDVVYAIDGTRVLRWDAAGRPLPALEAAGARLSVLASAGGRVVAGTARGRVAIWDGDGLVGVQHLHDAGVNALALSADGATLVTAGMDRVLRVWALPPPAATRWRADAGRVTQVAWDGARVLTAGGSGRAAVWEGGVARETLDRPGGWKSGVVLGADGPLAFEYDGLVQDRRGLRRCVAPPEGGYVQVVVPGPAGAVALGGQGMPMHVVATPDCAERVRLDLPRESFAAWSPDGRWIVAGRTPEGAEVFDAATGARHAAIRVPDATIGAVAFAPDGRTLAVGGSDGTVRFVATDTWTAGPTAEGHRGNVLALAWSADGRWLASTGADEGLLLWDRSRLAASFTSEHGDADTASFRGDGRVLATGHADGDVLLWGLDDLETAGADAAVRLASQLGLEVDGVEVRVRPAR